MCERQGQEQEAQEHDEQPALDPDPDRQPASIEQFRFTHTVAIPEQSIKPQLSVSRPQPASQQRTIALVGGENLL
jgi:hypothetical protein